MSLRGALVYIVDDDVSVGRSLSVLLKPHGFKTETFTRAADFLKAAHPKGPACVVLDIRMPDIDGLALQEAMETRKTDIPIIFISGHGNIPMSVKAMKAGAIDFLVKPFTEKNLLNAIALALTKNKSRQKEQADLARINRRLRTLTPREREVFRFVAQGLMNKEIAYKMGTVLQTVKVHRGRVMHKMQAKTLAELVRFAQKVGVVPPQH